MSEPKIIGVYRIKSKSNPNKQYIGSSIHMRKRWNLHKEDLRKNKHSNVKLQNHYNKYGEDDLEFILITICNKKEDVIAIEQKFLDVEKPFFNIVKTAGSLLGYHWKWSEESKKKFSEKKKGCVQSEEAKRKNREAHLGQVQWNKNKKNCFSETTREVLSNKMKEVWRLRKLNQSKDE